MCLRVLQRKNYGKEKFYLFSFLKFDFEIKLSLISAFNKTLGAEIRQLFCCHAASESYSYWYVCQVAVITENILSIWSHL
jgi:hypothetical protein